MHAHVVPRARLLHSASGELLTKLWCLLIVPLSDWDAWRARPHGDNGSRPLGDSLSPTKTPERERKGEREARVVGEVPREEFWVLLQSILQPPGETFRWLTAKHICIAQRTFGICWNFFTFSWSKMKMFWKVEACLESDQTVTVVI